MPIIGVGIGRQVRRPALPGEYVTGDQTGIVTVTATVSLTTGPLNAWVNGVTSGETTTYFANAIVVGPTQWVEFATVGSRQVTEARFYQQNSSPHGMWQWQGWNGSAWVDIGLPFLLGGSTFQVQTSLNGNLNSYTKYRIAGVTGLTSGSPYVYEFQFRVV